MKESLNAVFEWQPSAQTHNLGDHLVQLLGPRCFTHSAWQRLQSDTEHLYILIGSFICDYNLSRVVDAGRKPVLVGAGYRGEIVSGALIDQSIFVACRGRHTHELLRQHRLNVPVIGDPAVVLPILVPRRRRLRRPSLLVPHIGDPQRTQYVPGEHGCDALVQAETRDTDDLIRLIRDISSARFVLAGAMHAAIIAYAYGVPFAFFRPASGYLDCPYKWEDWLTSISETMIPVHFVEHLADGQAWFDRYCASLPAPRMVPVLSAYGRLGDLRPWLALRAALHDAWANFRELYQGARGLSGGETDVIEQAASTRGGIRMRDRL
ncbi:polysaccharide pyruvyl transferase family protein [Massilia sp. TS11]|uniref:polysaccharide pyruvyl transferase family protein n=1 Tax=Massilia sp. TS11 TaxID=2908003 RepID=UPI001EDA20F6|nr:polysaccharide pyruvyl transferase family protein [Massilia sp. TS11]MCG2582830.1 polysaccharide pyruvyl transferase family protein [Massilia sp. TS11]